MNSTFSRYFVALPIQIFGFVILGILNKCMNLLIEHSNVRGISNILFKYSILFAIKLKSSRSMSFIWTGRIEAVAISQCIFMYSLSKVNTI